MEITFIVEDGTGLATATSYVTLDEFKQYFYDRGYSYESLNDDDIKRLLNKSTQYIDNTYRKSFPGYRDTDTQNLEWGRYGAYYTDGFEIEEGVVPPEIKKSVNEVSYLTTQGFDLEEVIDKNGKLISESSAVDVIKEALEYEDGSAFYQDIYTSVDNILSRITGGISDMFTLTVLRTGGDSA